MNGHDGRGRSTGWFARAGSPLLLVILAATPFGGCSSSVNSNDVGVNVHSDAWYVRPSGKFNITVGGKPGSGSRIDVRDDLDAESSWESPSGLDVELGRHRFGLEFMPFQFNGTSTLDHPFVFHGASYGAGDETRTDLRFDTWKLRYDYELWTGIPDGDEPVAEVRGGFGALWWQFDTQIRNDTAGFKQERSFSHFYPGVTLSTKLPLGHGFGLEADALVAAIALDRRMEDLKAGVTWSARTGFAKGLTAEVGWRYVRFDINETTNDIDMIGHGPFFGLSYRF